MTLEELKIEVRKLPPEDRLALLKWIEQREEMHASRRLDLRRAVRLGLDQLDRGEFVECRNDAELHSFFEGVKSAGRKRLEAAPADF